MGVNDGPEYGHGWAQPVVETECSPFAGSGGRTGSAYRPAHPLANTWRGVKSIVSSSSLACPFEYEPFLLKPVPVSVAARSRLWA